VTGSVERVGELAAQGREQVSQTIDQVQEQAAQTTDRLAQFIQEQPVVAAALAVAAGAIVGAALPTTEAERRVLGPATARVTEKGRQVAGSVAAAVVPDAANSAADAVSREVLGRQQSNGGSPA